MQEISLIVTYTLKSNAVQSFLMEISKIGLPKLVHDEKGCICYEYYTSIDSSSNKIILIEKWKSKECQLEHLKQPHMIQFMEIKNRYVIKTDIQNL